MHRRMLFFRLGYVFKFLNFQQIHEIYFYPYNLKRIPYFPSFLYFVDFFLFCGFILFCGFLSFLWIFHLIELCTGKALNQMVQFIACFIFGIRSRWNVVLQAGLNRETKVKPGV